MLRNLVYLINRVNLYFSHLNKIYRVFSKIRMYYLSCEGKSQVKIVVDLV
jgi:hypothetical protein